MIDLTEEQVQALKISETTPPRVANPQTREMFVLVPLAEYERLSDREEYDDSPGSYASVGVRLAKAPCNETMKEKSR